MGLEIRPTAKTDGPELTELMLASLGPNPSMKDAWKRPASESLKQWLSTNRVKAIGGQPNHYDFVVVDTETGEIASEAAWTVEKQKENDDWKVFKAPGEVHEDLNEAIWLKNVKMDWAKAFEHMGPRPFVRIIRLRTHPKHQRRGAGGMLVKKFIDQANSLNLPAYLNATPEGYGLYRKYGFNTIEEVQLDYTKSFSEPYINYCMIHPVPAASSAPPQSQPTSTSTSFTLQRMELTHANMLVMIDLLKAAFGPSELNRVCFSGIDGKTTPDEQAAKELNLVLRAPDAYRFDVAVDNASGRIIALSKWHHVTDVSLPSWPNGRPEDRPAGINLACHDAMFGELRRRREALFRSPERGGRPYSYMCLLIADPGVQRRGIGSALLRWGLEEVDARQEECFIDASPEGLALYRRFGWRDVMEVTVDLSRWGGVGEATTVGLVRPVGGGSEK